MKKIVFLMLVALLLCGCVPAEQDKSTEQTQTGTEIQLGEENAAETFEVEMCYVNQIGGNIYSTARNADKLYFSGVQHLPIHKFGSAEELQNFVDQCDGDFVADQSYDEIPSFNTAIKDKDAHFFEENALLMVAVPANSGSFRYGVDSIDVKDGRLCVQVIFTHFPEAATLDLAGWFVLVTVPKSMADGCTEFDAYLQYPQ